MKSSLLVKLYLSVMVMITATLVLLNGTGCSKQGATGAFGGSAYTAEGKFVDDDSGLISFKAIVKGPADDLSLSLTRPNEKSYPVFIRKDEIAGNSADIDLAISNAESATYHLVLKIAKSDKVVVEKDIKLLLGKKRGTFGNDRPCVLEDKK